MRLLPAHFRIAAAPVTPATALLGVAVTPATALLYVRVSAVAELLAVVGVLVAMPGTGARWSVSDRRVQVQDFARS
ncbi:hypothetical protein ABZV31_03850 [Streptomyces sp. NPDC005202]|uniref:hypothetical protein n=1 Tax=Streptomyces sp. NPDC005202 TaxID=3157021 RepID=UPI0033A37D03